MGALVIADGLLRGAAQPHNQGFCAAPRSSPSAMTSLPSIMIKECHKSAQIMVNPVILSRK